MPSRPTNERARRRAVVRRRRQLRSVLILLGIVGVLVVLLTPGPSPSRVSSSTTSHSPPVTSSSPATELPKPVTEHPARAPADTHPQAVDPAGFAPGACVRYPPTSGDRQLTVFIDAGHGGVDPGAVGTTQSGQQVEEADLTLPVELDATADLNRAGFTVVDSRTGATTVMKLGPGDESGGLLTIQGARNDVAARDICANEAHADLLVGVYFDSGASPSNAGCVTGYDAVRSFAASNLRFAELLQRDVLSAMNGQGWQIPDEGVLTDDNLGSALSSAAVSYGHLMLLGPAEAGYFTTPSQMPGALIEPLFLTDPFEASIAASTHGQLVIAGGIAAAVEEYFDQ
jgi:N-acetylmuramoyl-L-alanine amidase